jgi:hypothetical protein
MPPPILRDWSDWCSTGCNRQSGGQNILGSVDVAVVMHTAAGAIPVADALRHRLHHMPASRASLTAREEAIHLHQGASVPVGLVLQLPDQLAPRCISDRAAVSLAAQHPLHAQVLDGDQLVLLDQPCRELVQVIPARVGDPGVDAGDPLPRLLAITRTLLLLGQPLLRLGQACAMAIEATRVRDRFTLAGDQQALEPKVHTDAALDRRERLDGVIVHQQGDVPTPGRRERDRHGGRCAALGDLPAPADRQRFRALCQEQLPITPTEGRTAELSRATVALLLEGRVLGPLGEEVGERRLEVSQRLLQRNAGDLVEELQIVLLLPGGEHGTGLEVGDRLALRRPGRAASIQRPVVDQAHATQCPAQERFLLGRWVEAVAEGSLHPYTLQDRRDSGKGHSAASSRLTPVAIPPRPEVRGFSRGIR